MEKKNHEILAALQYKPLCNITLTEKCGKEIQATAYNGASLVFVCLSKWFGLSNTCRAMFIIKSDYAPIW